MSKVERFPCWSCKESVSMRQRANADGDCPHCGAELDLEDWPIREPAAELLQAQATIAHQAQMIEHLRGGLTTPTHIDVANADADGFKNGRKSVGLLLRKGFNTLQSGAGEYKIVMQFSERDDAWAAYNEIGAISRLAGEE